MAHKLGAEMAPYIAKAEEEQRRIAELEEEEEEKARLEARSNQDAILSPIHSPMEGSSSPVPPPSSTPSSIKSPRLTWSEAALSTTIKDEKVGKGPFCNHNYSDFVCYFNGQFFRQTL